MKLHRATSHCYFTVGKHSFFFSYDTCVGYDGPDGSFRISNLWGPTTGRHMKEMGVYDYLVVDQRDFLEAMEAFGTPEFSQEVKKLNEAADSPAIS